MDKIFQKVLLSLYRVEANEGNDGGTDDPVGELEVRIPFVNCSLEPTQRLPETQRVDL